MTERSMHTPGPWGLCNEGKCSCMTVSCGDYPIAKVTCGKWGDDYATVRLEGGSLDTRAIAVMEQITYGEIDEETATANARLIAAAPDLLAALKLAEGSMAEHNKDRLLSENQANPCDWDFGEGCSGTLDVVRHAIAKATGEKSATATDCPG